MKEFKIRNEINNEITKGYDEDTSEVKSSTEVKWEENLPMDFHSEEKSKNKEVSDSTSIKRSQH